jgi:hypothetical protein
MKIPAELLIDTDTIILKYIWKGTRLAKERLKKK